MGPEGGKLLRRDIKSRGFELTGADGVLAGGSQGDRTSPGATEGTRSLIKYQGEGLSLNCLTRILAETGLDEEVHGWAFLMAELRGAYLMSGPSKDACQLAALFIIKIYCSTLTRLTRTEPPL